MIINASSYTSAIPVAPSNTINIPGPSARFTGATTAVVDTSGYMRDTNANFVTTYNANGSINNEGVAPGMVVYNMYAMVASGINAPAVATVLEVVDNNTLLLSADIFPFAGGVAVQDYKIFNSNEQDSPGACIYVGTTGNIYVETLQGDLVFIESVPAGEVIPVMVQKVLVGAAAGGGSPNTLTTTGELIAYF